MTRAQQKKFVKELMKTVGNTMVERAEMWPEDWEEKQLREMIADKFDTVRDSEFDKRSRDGRLYKSMISSLI